MIFAKRVSTLTIAAACFAAPALGQTALNEGVYQNGVERLRAAGYSVGTVRQDSMGQLTFYACAGADGRILTLSGTGAVVSDDRVACTSDFQTAARQPSNMQIAPGAAAGGNGTNTTGGTGDQTAGGGSGDSDDPATGGDTTGSDVAAGIGVDADVGVGGSDGGIGVNADADVGIGGSGGSSGSGDSGGIGVSADVGADVGSDGISADVGADVGVGGSDGLGLGLDVSVGLGG